jgi:hypothetical protein
VVVCPLSSVVSVGFSVSVSALGWVSVASFLGSGRVTVEELVQGARELECAVFSQNGKLLFTNIGEISYETGFYDYDTKYSSHSGVRILTSARISPEQKTAVLGYSRAIAQALGVKAQYKRAVAGGNDAGAIHQSRGGVRTLAISLACRYLHAPSTVASKADCESMLALARAMCEKIAGGDL